MKNLSIGILAHVDAGKTTLSEGLLYQAGQLRRMGRVDKKDAFLDTFALEKERGITIFSKQAVLTWGQTYVTLLDTPGHVDFSAEMERTLQVLDYAILVVSATDGVQGHTRTLGRLLDRYEIPTFIFVNKMDQPGADQESVLQQLNREMDGNFVDFTESDEEVFYENISLCDEELLNHYLKSGEISDEEIAGQIRKRNVFPCYFGSALHMEGIDRFMQGLSRYTSIPHYPESFGAKVYKISRDESGNRLTHVKVTGGVLRARMELDEGPDRGAGKVNQIRIYSGDKYQTVPEVSAGCICALTGLSETYPGQGLGREPDSARPVLGPVLTYSLQLPETVDAATILPKLRQLQEEEPELHVVWSEELQEIHVQVMGEVQIEILQRMIEERFGVHVTFDTGRIVYQETIQNPVLGIGHFEPLRHYAEVHLLIEPLERGSGFQIESRCSEDRLDKNWQRLILTHLLEREHPGVLTGGTLTDVRVVLVAGRSHQKHTEGGDFRQATYRAVRQGLMQAESILLEPYYRFRLEVPKESVGRAMTDIERMSGTFVMEQVQEDDRAVLTGSAPVITMRNYPREVTAYTKGRGHIFCEADGYRPCHNAQEVIEEIGYDPERDMANPTGSVFCAHGTGFYVPWDEVKSYSHIKDETQTDPSSKDDSPVSVASQYEEGIDIEEIDRILERTSHANRKSGPVSHKGISGKKVRSLTAKPVGLSKPRKQERKEPCLLVDGYNIIFAWKELAELAKENMDAARDRLMDILCDYQGFKKCRLILVFDAYRVQNHKTEVISYHNILVVFTKEAETADQYIEKFAHEKAGRYAITVATSDGLEQVIIRGAGCRLLSARDLEAEIQRTRERMREYLDRGDS